MRRFLQIIFKALTVVSVGAMLTCMAIGAVWQSDIHFAYAILCMVSAILMFMGAELMEDRQ